MTPRTAIPGSSGKAMRWLEGKILYSMGFGIAFLLLIGATLFYFYASPSSTVIRIAYGSGGPGRKYFLEQLAAHGKERNLDIRLVPSEGADETLSLIHQNGADLGLIVGAIEDRAERDVLEVTPLYMEPLHLLVREELYESISKDFGQLKGKSINLESRNSTTNLMATELLQFIGLTDQSGKPQYRPVYMTQSELSDPKNSASLPDAIFEIGGIPSPSVRSLIVNNNYRLVALPFGGSFNLDRFREADALASTESSTVRLDRTFVEESVIPAFVYSVLPSVPPADTRTIASRMVLIGSSKLDSQVVHRVLELIFSPEISNLVKPALTVELLNSSYEFERHPGTDRYLNSLKPFDYDGAFQAYGRVGEVWGLIITLYLGAGKLLKMRKERGANLQRKSVGDFLTEVLAVEGAAHASCTDEERISLDQRLTDIKKALIELHLNGRLQDPENFHSLMVTLADTRTRIWGSVS